MDLYLNLKSMVDQQLVPTENNDGRIPCLEILINTPLVSDLVRKGEVHELKELMKKSTEQGMRTFDQSLYALFEKGEITYDDALAHADSANDLRLMIKLKTETTEDSLERAADGLSLEGERKPKGIFDR